MIRGLNELKWEDFFLDFIKGPLQQLTERDWTIKLSVLKLCSRDQIPFDLRLLISHALHFQVFNVTDNLKATRTTHSFITELKISDKSLFWYAFEKVFCSPTGSYDHPQGSDKLLIPHSQRYTNSDLEIFNLKISHS